MRDALVLAVAHRDVDDMLKAFVDAALRLLFACHHGPACVEAEGLGVYHKPLAVVPGALLQVVGIFSCYGEVIDSTLEFDERFQKEPAESLGFVENEPYLQAAFFVYSVYLGLKLGESLAFYLLVCVLPD